MSSYASAAIKLANRRRLFNLSWLVLLAPLYFLYQQMNPQPASGESKQLLDEKLGPYRVVLIEDYAELPVQGPNGTWVKHYALECHGCGDGVRAAFLSANHTARDGATLCSGGPELFSCQLAFSSNTPEQNATWLILETWKGKLWKMKVESA